METENPGAALSAAELEQFYAEALTVDASVELKNDFPGGIREL